MSSNVREFNLAVGTFSTKEVPDFVGKVHRGVALEALKGIVLMTPVDTGRARGNWQVTMDTPAAGEVGAAFEGNTGKGRRGKVARAAFGQTVTQGSAVIAGVKPFSLTWITNNVPYIEGLENGSSTQAPRGMLAVTFARLSAWLGRQR